jgi:hypothetical protein
VKRSGGVGEAVEPAKADLAASFTINRCGLRLHRRDGKKEWRIQRLARRLHNDETQRTEAQHGEIASSYDYPAVVAGRYAMSPSPIPRFDNPKLHMSEALHLFGAGREKRVYCVPPHTPVISLDFEDYPFKRGSQGAVCELCGAEDTFLDEVVTGDQGERIWVCSDADYCEERRERRERSGRPAPDPPEAPGAPAPRG